MRWNDIFIDGLGTWCPPRTPVAEAVAAGRYSAAMNTLADFESVLDADANPDEHAYEMSERAALCALEAAGVSPEEIELLISISIDQGDHLNPGSYLQHRLKLEHTHAVELRNASNGTMSALPLAAAWLTASRGARAALLSAADTFRAPRWNRWQSVPGLIMADAAAALVLSARTGWARLIATSFRSAPELEANSRMTGTPESSGDVHQGLEDSIETLRTASRAHLEELLEEAETPLKKVRWLVAPNIGRNTLELLILDHFGLGLETTTWSWGRTIGHAGACDHVLALTQLQQTKRLAPGDRVLLFGLGGGYTWSSAVIEVLAAAPDRRRRAAAGYLPIR